MKKILAAASILVAVALPTYAQDNSRVRDNLYVTIALPCFADPEYLFGYIETETNQKPLLTGVGVATLATPFQPEVDVPGLTLLQLDPVTGDYNMTITFEDGTTCILNEGTSMTPYTQ